MLCRTVTRLGARRKAAPVVTPAATAPEATPEATGPEVVIPTARATEVAAEGCAATPDPVGAEEESPLVPGGDSTEDFARHVSVLDFSCHFLASLSGVQRCFRRE